MESFELSKKFPENSSKNLFEPCFLDEETVYFTLYQFPEELRRGNRFEEVVQLLSLVLNRQLKCVKNTEILLSVNIRNTEILIVFVK